MLDIKYIREHADAVRDAARRKKIACDLDKLLVVDRQRVELQQAYDGLKARINEGGAQMGLMRNPKSDWYRRAVEGGMATDQIKAEAEKLQKELTELKGRLKPTEDALKPIEAEFEALMLTVPQPPAAEVPDGKDDTENVEVKRVGEVRSFDFKPLDHVELGKRLDIIDIERGVKLAGTRNYILKGDGCLLHQAVLRLAHDMMIARGYLPMTVPVLVREEVMQGTGYFPAGREQAYLCERDGLSLVGTAEVPVTAYHTDEILTESDLPLKFVAMSGCFRREAGAAGKDTAGLYRIHLFEKVEQVIIGPNDEQRSRAFHDEIVRNSEDVLAALKLPYRIVNVCTGDLGQGQVQKFDIETWMPSRGGYGETHSASRFHEFQARRLKLRYRDSEKRIRFCHTLNNTVIASPRILIPILELYQNADGTVTIPDALRPYMGQRERIVPRGG